MEMKTFLATFAIVFLAELGDKTQLAVLLFASKGSKGVFPWDVCLGACLALVTTTLIATVLGYVGKAAVPERVLHYVAATGFIGIGIWMFLTK